MGQSLRKCAEAPNVSLVASEAMRSGLDYAKAGTMDVSRVSFVLPLLKPALDSGDAVMQTVGRLAMEHGNMMVPGGVTTRYELSRIRIRKTPR